MIRIWVPAAFTIALRVVAQPGGAADRETLSVPPPDTRSAIPSCGGKRYTFYRRRP